MKLRHAAALKNRAIRSILLLILIACSACSFGKDKSIAEAGVAQFHKQFNAGQSHEIYRDSGTQMKAATTESEFVAVLEGTRRKLGSVRGSRETRWNVQETISGTYAILNYDTEFSEGKGTEQFTFKISNDSGTLVGYHVESPLFITR